MTERGLRQSHRTVTSDLNTQQDHDIVPIVNKVPSTLKPKKLLKYLFDSIVLDSDLNKGRINEILKKPEYMDNALFQKYVNKESFPRILKCRIYDEKKRHANKPASQSSSLPVVRQGNEDNQLAAKPLLEGVAPSQVENQSVVYGISKRVKLSKQNREKDLWFVVKQLQEELNTMKQQLKASKKTIASLASNQKQHNTKNRKREDKENKKQDYMNNKKITTTIKEVEPITNKDGQTPNSNIKQILGENRYPQGNGQKKLVQFAEQEVNSQMQPKTVGAQFIGRYATVPPPQNQPIDTAIQSLEISTPYEQNQEELEIDTVTENSSDEFPREHTGNSLLYNERTDAQKLLEKQNQSKPAVVFNKVEITALGKTMKRASLACLDQFVGLNNDIIEFILNIMLKSTPEELRKKFIVEDMLLYSDIASKAHSDDAIMRRLEDKILKNKNDCCYYILPVHLADKQHWSLAIFGNINQKLSQDETYIELDSGIFCLYLDSLYNATNELYENMKRIGHLIKQVLGVVSETFHLPFYGSRLNIPKQNNDYDSGICLLEYAARFLKDPSSLILNTSAVIYPGNFYRLFERWIHKKKTPKKGLSVENVRVLDECYNHKQRVSTWFNGDSIKERRENINVFFDKLRFVIESSTDTDVIEMFKESYQL